MEAVQRGAFDYLTKPFVKDELRAKIARALAAGAGRATASGCCTVGRDARVVGRAWTACSSRRPGRRRDDRGRALHRVPDRRRAARAGGERRHAGRRSWSRARGRGRRAAMDKNAPTIRPRPDGRVIVAAPLVGRAGSGRRAGDRDAGARRADRGRPRAPRALLVAGRGRHPQHARARAAAQRRARGARPHGDAGRARAQEPAGGPAALRAAPRAAARARGDEDEGAELARKITATVDHLAAVVSEITAFGRTARAAAGADRPRRRSSTNASRSPSARQVARETSRSTRAHDPACPPAAVDPREMRKAFLNLILNGLESLGTGRPAHA